MYGKYHRFGTVQGYLSELNHHLPDTVTWDRNISTEGDIGNNSEELQARNAHFFAMM